MRFYRGTSLSQLKHNFEGEHLANNSPTRIASYDFSSSLETAVYYADKHMEDGLVIVLEFEVPEKDIFSIDDFDDRDERYEAEEEGKIFDKPGVETDFRTMEMSVDFLEAIHEFKQPVESMEEFKQRGHHINLQNNAEKKVENYIRERT
jgi:hypothetical protein